MIYIYEREDGTYFEYSQSMKDKALTHCPETGQCVRRVITGGKGTFFVGPWGDKNRQSEERHMKNLAKDPFYTTLSDHKKIIEKRAQERLEVAKKFNPNITEL
jgi:predicted nucleic acid-binding Zn ribbon protein